MASKDIMIDIETLSLDAEALVLSIGAVPFDCLAGTNAPGPWMGEAFFATPSIIEQLLLGRTVDKSTQRFWANQPVSVSDHWAGNANTVGVADALTTLADFVDGAPRIWAHGAVFDVGVLESLYRQFQLPIPWKYNAIRDARTFYDTNPETRRGQMPDVIAHHPVEDCKRQIVRLWEHGLVTT